MTARTEERVLAALAEVMQHCWPEGLVDRSRSLTSLGVEGPRRLLLIVRLESLCSINLPAGLLTAIETIDDLVYYVAIHAERA